MNANDPITGTAEEGSCSSYPSSCTAIYACNPGSPDGAYALYYQGVSTQPWNAYCYDMASGWPTTYLPLVEMQLAK